MSSPALPLDVAGMAKACEVETLPAFCVSRAPYGVVTSRFEEE